MRRNQQLGVALLSIVCLVAASCRSLSPGASPAPTQEPTPFILQLISDPQVKESEGASFMIQAEHPERTARGTGVSVGQDLILTAFHLVGNPSTGEITAEEVRVSQPHLDWKQGCLARVAAADPALDLALLACETIGELPSLQFGDPNELVSGDTVYAVGHEFFPTYDVGALYPRDGEIAERPEEAFFLVSPPFVRGFSGGGVFNLDHEVVGIALRGYLVWDTEEDGVLTVTRQGTIVRRIDVAFPLLEESGAR